MRVFKDFLKNLFVVCYMVFSLLIQVLDATDNEPWGPHGTALAEIAQATKKLLVCVNFLQVMMHFYRMMSFFSN